MDKDVSHNKFLIHTGAVQVQAACNYHGHLKNPVTIDHKG